MLTPITAKAASIRSDDDAAIWQGIFGADGVLNVGGMLAYEIVGTNTIKIKDGVCVVGGHVFRIRYGSDVEVTVANGVSGKNRNDIIYAEYSTTGFGGTDGFDINIKQGASTTGTPEDPELNTADVYSGNMTRQIPLYRVKLSGTQMEVERLFRIIPTPGQSVGGAKVISVPAGHNMVSLLSWQEVNEALGTDFDQENISYKVYVSAMNGGMNYNDAKIIATGYNTSSGMFNVYFDKAMDAAKYTRISYMITIVSI